MIKNYILPNYVYENKILFTKSTTTMKIQFSMQARKNKCSLSFRLKVSTDCQSLNDCVREFHTIAEAKANNRPSYRLYLEEAILFS